MFYYLLTLNIVLYKRNKMISNLIFINSQLTLHIIFKKFKNLKNLKYIYIYIYILF